MKRRTTVKDAMVTSAVVVTSIVLSVLAPATALAQTPRTCSSLAAENPVHMLIGATQEPLFKALGKKLREGPRPITLVYKTSGSCTNIAEFVKANPKLTQNANYIPSSTENAAWVPTDPAPQCQMDVAGGVDLDIANSNVFVSACTTVPLPASVAAINGPVQAYAFVVPRGSSQTAITAEEAYFTFGFGGKGQVVPWSDPAFLFLLPPSRSTFIATMLAAGINPPSKAQGTVLSDPNEVLNAVAQSTSAEKTLGIVGTELYDAYRDKLKLLAFRAFKQRYAYYPDSTATSLDKYNLRNGLYFPWSPTVYLARVDAGGVPTKENVRYLLDLIVGKTVTPAPGFEPQDEVVKAGVVPVCAMNVTRTAEGSDLSVFEPSEPCGCYFESKVGTKRDSCKSCTDDAACGNGKCRKGFCETR